MSALAFLAFAAAVRQLGFALIHINDSFKIQQKIVIASVRCLASEVDQSGTVTEKIAIEPGSLVGSVARVWSVVFTTTMIARLLVQLPTESRCCVLG